ncbi:MAG: hypothetical protein JRJ85_13630 [Deltaproteobacteria bacterium]|nr:hypothetical protein [Deltaproteobacteria bacterium]
MDLFNILAILITLTALFSYTNHRYIGLPITIGVMLIALLISLLLNLLDALGFGLKHYARMVLGSIPLDKTLLHGMLSFLLFAGALHINIDEILNAILFVLIGLEILILTFAKQYLLLSLLMILFVLTARFISIGIPMTLLSRFRTFTPGAVRILTWGGLRGGISVALALSIPPVPERHLILTFTYTVVLFSILVKGSTIKKLTKHIITREEEKAIG